MSTGQIRSGAAAAKIVFETRDFYLACFLPCTGYDLIDLRTEGPRKVFVFRDRPTRRDDVLAIRSHCQRRRGSGWGGSVGTLGGRCGPTGALEGLRHGVQNEHLMVQPPAESGGFLPVSGGAVTSDANNTSRTGLCLCHRRRRLTCPPRAQRPGGVPRGRSELPPPMTASTRHPRGAVQPPRVSRLAPRGSPQGHVRVACALPSGRASEGCAQPRVSRRAWRRLHAQHQPSGLGGR